MRTSSAKYWRQRFFDVDRWGRSHFRLLITGICLVAIWATLEFAHSPASLTKAARSFGLLGVIFVIWSGIGPTFDVVIQRLFERKKKQCAQPGH